MERSIKMNKNRDYLEIMQVACDDICKYRDKLNQEDLEEKCNECPLAKIVNSKID